MMFVLANRILKNNNEEKYTCPKQHLLKHPESDILGQFNHNE